MAEEVMGVDRGSKRARGSEASGGASSKDLEGGVKKMLGNLPVKVGQGDHEQPILEAVLQGMRDLSMDMQDIKGAMYHSWEMPDGSPYVDLAMDYKGIYSEACKKARGTGTNLGHQKNYVMMGIFLAYQADGDNSPKEKEVMEELLGTKLRNADKKLDIGNAKDLADIVAHCQVVKTKRKGFMNILMRGDKGVAAFKLLEKALDREGHRQWDPPPPKPVHKDLKMAVEQARRIGKSS